MLRSIVLVLSLLVGGTAYAAGTDFGDIFTPTEGDHSLYIISKIFGNVDQNVLPGEASASGPELLGNIFRIFNIATLGLGVLMVLYTVIVAVLQTAHHGKMMGERSGTSLWTPIRIAFAIAMLIPKSNGYCMAQVFVMWLVVQGVGAADSIWNTALDYFAEGGSIGQAYPDEGQEGSLNKSLDAVYAQTFLNRMLQAATCIASHNRNSTLEAPYAIQRFTTPDSSGNKYYLYFGSDVKKIDHASTAPDLGHECGMIPFDVAWGFTGDEAIERTNLAHDTQRGITYDQFATVLLGIAYKIVDDEIVYNEGIAPEFDVVKGGALNYINSMGTNAVIFMEPPEEQQQEALDILRAGGWILAGNYYQVLASIEGYSDFHVEGTNTPVVTYPGVDQDHLEDTKKAVTFYDNFSKWDGRHVDEAKTPAQLSRDQVEAAFGNQSEIFDEMGLSQATAEHMEGFINMISGEEGSTDPVLRAARYGQELMNTSAKWMISLASILPLMSAIFGFCTGMQPGELVWNTMIATTVPVAYGMLGFLYVQGAALGVYLPMIPFIIFVIGGLGWIFSVVESMVAAPIIALGLTIDGHEIYGKAEPAVMLLINLVLRPSFIMIGFLCSMMVAWLAVDLLNISMMSALEFGGIAPDWMFGPHVISFMYVAVLIALLTKVFGLITYIPDTVMRSLGDHSKSMLTHEDTTGATQRGAEGISKQTGDSAQATGSSTTSFGTSTGKSLRLKSEGVEQ